MVTFPIPVKHGEGRYVIGARELAELTAREQVLVRYVGGNPNGSVDDIAGVCGENRRMVGLMPHPEHAVESLTGPGTDGLRMLSSALGDLLAVS